MQVRVIILSDVQSAAITKTPVDGGFLGTAITRSDDTIFILHKSVTVYSLLMLSACESSFA